MSTTGIELDSVARGNMGRYQRLSDEVDQIPLGYESSSHEQPTRDELDRLTHKSHYHVLRKFEGAIEKIQGSSLAQYLLHTIPLIVTLVILGLNIFKVYWQDLGHPNQKAILQALQYAAKAHEIMITASLSAIVLHRLQYGLSDTQGIPFGLLVGGFKLSEPFYLCTNKFLGPTLVQRHSDPIARLRLLSVLILVGIALTLVVGPSSAVVMIPRLDWWEVSQAKAFGTEYKDRVYFNRTEDDLWPEDISNAIYADTTICSAGNVNDDQDCAVRAMDPVGNWIRDHQNQGTKPNITIFQDSEITRYLTSQGGPPDNSSWTVTSTVNSIFGRDLVHYWDWLIENSTLPTNIARPLIRPHFVNSTIKVKKPLVQVQCQTWIEPDWESGTFAFPHDKLLTPPLDQFEHETCVLPNDFILDLKGNDTDIGDPNDNQHSHILFDWFDAASNFSTQGAP